MGTYVNCCSEAVGPAHEVFGGGWLAGGADGKCDGFGCTWVFTPRIMGLSCVGTGALAILAVISTARITTRGRRVLDHERSAVSRVGGVSESLSRVSNSSVFSLAKMTLKGFID